VGEQRDRLGGTRHDEAGRDHDADHETEARLAPQK
jgi:hypothetical protein